MTQQQNANILLLTHGLPPPFLGGSGRYLFNVFSRLPNATVTIFTEVSRIEEPTAASMAGVRFIRRQYIHPFANPRQSSPVRKLIRLRMLVLWAFELIALCIRSRPDLIFVGQARDVGLLAVLAKWVFGIPYIVFIYGEELTKAYKLPLRARVIRMVCRQASKVITISNFTVAELVKQNIDRGQIVLAAPGIDVQAFKVEDQARLASFRAQLAPQDYRVLLTVGRLTERKGQAEVIAILPEVIKTIPRLRYVVAGTDSGEGQKLRHLVKQLGLEQQVVFLGRVTEEDLPLLYNACDVFIMANRELPNSDTEGFGIVFLEANAARKPVIGGNAGGVKDAVADGVSGLLVNADNPDALRKAIETLLLDKAYASKLGEQGYQRIQAEYSWDHTAAIIRECAEQIIYG